MKMKLSWSKVAENHGIYKILGNNYHSQSISMQDISSIIMENIRTNYKPNGRPE